MAGQQHPTRRGDTSLIRCPHLVLQWRARETRWGPSHRALGGGRGRGKTDTPTPETFGSLGAAHVQFKALHRGGNADTRQERWQEQIGTKSVLGPRVAFVTSKASGADGRRAESGQDGTCGGQPHYRNSSNLRTCDWKQNRGSQWAGRTAPLGQRGSLPRGGGGAGRRPGRCRAVTCTVRAPAIFPLRMRWIM